MSKHELDGVPASERRRQLRELWENEARKQGDAARNSEAEKHFGPPERWPGYNIQKVRAVSAAAKLLERRDKAIERLKDGARAERFYSAYGGRLRGRADAVYSRDGRTEIEDYKTGAIYDEVPGVGQTLKARFRRQLLLYAAMHHDETGEWPAAGAVVPLSGPKERFPIDPLEAEQEARVALETMASYNELVRAPGARPESLASPTPSACGYCSHKLTCAPFWYRASPEWAWTSGEAVRGTALRIARGSTGSWHGEVEVRGGTLEKGVYGIEGSNPVPLAEKEQFMAINVKIAKGLETPSLAVTDYTTIRVMRGAERDKD